MPGSASSRSWATTTKDHHPQSIIGELEQAGFETLEGRWTTVDVDGTTLAIGGTSAPWGPDVDPNACPPADFRILLSHSPDRFYRAARWGIDLMFSGHNHGGQIRLPLVGAVFMPSVYSRRFDRGFFRRGADPDVRQRGRRRDAPGALRLPAGSHAVRAAAGTRIERHSPDWSVGLRTADKVMRRRAHDSGARADDDCRGPSRWSIGRSSAMPSPFPGMDPHLEEQGFWVDVHLSLICEIQARLKVELRPKYYARIDERVYSTARVGIDHRYISESRRTRVWRRGYLIIEILKPRNKVPKSPGRDSFEQKRREVMDSPIHRVEIDLLRGECMARLPGEDRPARVPGQGVGERTATPGQGLADTIGPAITECSDPLEIQ